VICHILRTQGCREYRSRCYLMLSVNVGGLCLIQAPSDRRWGFVRTDGAVEIGNARRITHDMRRLLCNRKRNLQSTGAAWLPPILSRTSSSKHHLGLLTLSLDPNTLCTDLWSCIRQHIGWRRHSVCPKLPQGCRSCSPGSCWCTSEASGYHISQNTSSCFSGLGHEAASRRVCRHHALSRILDHTMRLPRVVELLAMMWI
jgi:hypothetical protein